MELYDPWTSCGGKKENMIGLDKAHSLNSKTSDSCNFVHM